MIAVRKKLRALIPGRKGIVERWCSAGGGPERLSLLEKRAALVSAHFIEAGSAMKPIPLPDWSQSRQHLLIPQTAPGSAVQPAA